MSEMVDRVARALFQRDVDEDICDGTWEESPALHEKFFADARAAIAAMREPASAMQDEAVGVLDSHDVGSHEAGIVWRAMIDEALK